MFAEKGKMTKERTKSLDGRASNGGARQGAGRKRQSSEQFSITLHHDIRAKLDRFAAEHGIPPRTKGSGWWNYIIKTLIDAVETKEPEYLTLARSIHENR